ncbi:PREDICTED: proteasome maturation protein-like [Rhagoletis zephyria]|uniref:proteasome maturation protein-like n=1 Tax=Rhagoletis zephyria TaxID=28612 RepID=UPI0008118235|nr:PREDICTED: proteasome maturation protein-like [Rhagoletis zephyria]
MSLPVKAQNIAQETVQYAKKANAGEQQDKLNPADSSNPQKSVLLHGFSSVKQQAYGSTPLEKLEKSAFDREQYRNMTMLRSVQGIHAPLRLLAERKAASHVGHLPFLPRSNLMLDVLEGRDEMITPNEIFNGKPLAQIAEHKNSKHH